MPVVIDYPEQATDMQETTLSPFGQISQMSSMPHKSCQPGLRFNPTSST
jgi:hypothetical protein